MIDWERVAELQEEVGSDDFPEVVELFFEEVEEALARLETHPDSNAETLHFLKGSALNLGFNALSELCKAAEARVGGLDEGDKDAIAKAYWSAKREIGDAL